ncbi:MAG: penicillin acylase family protein [Desulfobacterales bacterium]|nr:penicillin acylase family protein [Desulfobacterales bacterium]
MAMAMGYVHASDRLTQMAAIRLMSEGRLSEMAGASMIDLDLYMRTMNLRTNSPEPCSRTSAPRTWPCWSDTAPG